MGISEIIWVYLYVYMGGALRCHFRDRLSGRDPFWSNGRFRVEQRSEARLQHMFDHWIIKWSQFNIRSWDTWNRNEASWRFAQRPAVARKSQHPNRPRKSVTLVGMNYKILYKTQSTEPFPKRSTPKQQNYAKWCHQLENSNCFHDVSIYIIFISIYPCLSHPFTVVSDDKKMAQHPPPDIRRPGQFLPSQWAFHDDVALELFGRKKRNGITCIILI